MGQKWGLWCAGVVGWLPNPKDLTPLVFGTRAEAAKAHDSIGIESAGNYEICPYVQPCRNGPRQQSHRFPEDVVRRRSGIRRQQFQKRKRRRRSDEAALALRQGCFVERRGKNGRESL